LAFGLWSLIFGGKSIEASTVKGQGQKSKTMHQSPKTKGQSLKPESPCRDRNK